MPISTGYRGLLAYGYESSFRSGTVANANKVFGLNQRVGSLRFGENLNTYYTIGSRVAEGFAYGPFEGSMSVDFYLANPWFFKSLLNRYNVTSEASAYIHTFEVDNTVPSLVILSGTQDAPVLIKGAVVSSATISTAVDEVVSVSLDINFAEAVSLTSAPSQPSETFRPFTFAHGALYRDATMLGYVQNIEISMDNAANMVRSVGSRLATDYFAGLLTIEGRMSIVMTDNSWLLRALENLENHGPSKIATNLKLTLNNGEQTIELDLQDVYLTEESLGLEPGEMVVYELPFRAKNVVVRAINNISSMP